MVIFSLSWFQIMPLLCYKMSVRLWFYYISLILLWCPINFMSSFYGYNLINSLNLKSMLYLYYVPKMNHIFYQWLYQVSNIAIWFLAIVILSKRYYYFFFLMTLWYFYDGENNFNIKRKYLKINNQNHIKNQYKINMIR